MVSSAHEVIFMPFNPHAYFSINWESTKENLRDLMVGRISPEVLAEAMFVTPRTVRNWLNDPECSATRFLRNSDRILEKKAPVLRNISEARSLASAAPKTAGRPTQEGGLFRLREGRLLPPLSLPFRPPGEVTLPALRPGLLRAPGRLHWPLRARRTPSTRRPQAPTRCRQSRTSTSCRCAIGVSVPVVAAAGEESALVFCPVDGDGLAGDVALPVQVIPRDIDQDDAVANKQGLVSVLDLYPLELIRLRAGSVSEGIVRHAAGHRRNVASRRRAVICTIVTPRLCGPFENRAVVVEAAELDGSEILRHKGSLLPF